MWNRDSQPSAASANLDGAPHGFKVTGDAAWDSDSTDYAMFSERGNELAAQMVRTAREMTLTAPEAQVLSFIRSEKERIASMPERSPRLPHLPSARTGYMPWGHGEIYDTMVRETIAYALDEAWERAYGHRFPGDDPVAPITVNLPGDGDQA